MTDADPSFAIVPTKIEERQLQAIFNAGGYMDRAMAGEFACCILSDSGANKARPAVGTHPPNRRTVTVAFLDHRRYRVFAVQFFLYEDPKGGDAFIGASGREDPKWLWVEEEGVVYSATPRQIIAAESGRED